MKIKTLIIFITLFCVNLSFSQTEKQFLKAGNSAFENGQYYEAISYLKNAVKFNKNNNIAIYKTAMSYYNLKDYENAAIYFEQIKVKDDYPLIDFYAASNQKLLGNYKEAISLFQAFDNNYPIQGFYKAKAQQEVASCYWALDQKINKDDKIVQLEKPLNTGYSDFGATYLSQNEIQVSSLQSITKNLNSDFIADIFSFDKSDHKFTKNDSFKFPKSNNSLDYANGFYLAEKEEFYYSECYTEHELGEKICDIYVRKYKNNKWGDATKLNINTDEHTETQAQLSVNKGGETILYFVSDRPGGKGKLDIWTATEISFGNFTDPINLPAPINTIDNESTPFFDQEKQSLYFSSEWHYGFGGYDIFESKLNNNTWEEPKNLGTPINTSANDQYFYPTPYETALFSSNREGAMQLKGSACCFDIFEYYIPETKLDSNKLTASNFQDKNKLVDGNNHINNDYNNINPNYSDYLINSNSSLKNKLDKVSISLENLKNKLPATVYFHNDEPNPKSTATKTRQTYQKAYEDYLNVKTDYFEIFNNELAITNWFQLVEEAYGNLNLFLKELAIVLPEQKMTLTIEGYCSPLALNEYNINLAKRRIVSLQNYILKWNHSELKSYFDSGELKFETAPFGEEKANQNISDSPDNTKESIYNPQAAQERRVAIIAIETK